MLVLCHLIWATVQCNEDPGKRGKTRCSIQGIMLLTSSVLHSFSPSAVISEYVNPYIPIQNPEEDFTKWQAAITRLTAHFTCSPMSTPSAKITLPVLCIMTRGTAGSQVESGLWRVACVESGPMSDLVIYKQRKVCCHTRR